MFKSTIFAIIHRNKNKCMKNKLVYIVLSTFLAVFLQAAAVNAEAQSFFTLEAYGIDTIAGFPASIRSSKTLPDKQVFFNIEKPDGTVLTIPITSNEDGIAKFDLYDYHTKEAGEYHVSAKLENKGEGKVNSFTVFPDSVSSEKSSISASKLLATADGLDNIYFTVKLKDKHGNPIKGHSLEIVSSRNSDSIKRVSEKNFTNDEGSMVFASSSNEKGVSVYSFLDTTSGTTLKDRIEVAYKGLEDVGGFIPTAYAQAGQISSFEFSNLPDSITPNSDVSFTLTAVDAEGNIVPNYAGTVHFSAEGSNSTYASLPKDYTFDIDIDAGSHEFSGINALNFSQAGTYAIVATDLGDFTVRGETNITVGQGTQTTTTDASGDNLVITSPSPGTYSNSQIPILGTSPKQDYIIQIFDNDQNIGQTTVESDNTYRFEPTILEDGQHTVFTAGVDGDGVIQATSEEITFTIDTTPPIVEDIRFNPSNGIQTGDVIDITVISEPDVFQGAVIFNVDIAELEPDSSDPTKYLASIQSPSEPGLYPVDVILVDELGNEGNYQSVASLQVDDKGDGIITEPGDEPSDPIIETPEPPSDVFGVKATSSDKRVTLTWEPASDNKGIDHYRVYYGLTPGNLNTIVNTFDDTNTWYIPDLENGTEYFFAVTAINMDGIESENKSSIVSAIPFSPAPVFVVPETPPQPVAPPTQPAVPAIEATGPEVLFFLLFSFFASQVYFKFKKKVC